MKLKASLILVVFMLLCMSIDDIQKASAQASGKSKGRVERASTASEQTAVGLVPAQETNSPAPSVRVEPLLLLLLGSTLFSIGTAINLILSRKLSPKSIRTMTSSK